MAKRKVVGILVLLLAGAYVGYSKRMTIAAKLRCPTQMKGAKPLLAGQRGETLK
jgi:hypothetical protein